MGAAVHFSLRSWHFCAIEWKVIPWRDQISLPIDDLLSIIAQLTSWRNVVNVTLPDMHIMDATCERRSRTQGLQDPPW